MILHTEGTDTKRTSFGILFILCLIFSFMGAGLFACAEDALLVTCTFSPADFIGPTQAKLSVTVKNGSANTLENVRISPDANQDGELIGDLAPGETMHYAVTANVTKKMLDAGKMTVYFSYKEAGKTRRTQTQIKVSRVNALAQATLTCRIDRTMLYEGETAFAEYRLVNTGTVAIQNAVVSDAAFQFTSQPVTLQPGEEKVFSHIASFTSGAISSPRASFFSAVSGNEYVLYAGSTAVHVSNDNIAYSVVPDTVTIEGGQRARFNISFKNNGLFRYSDLSLSSGALGTFPCAVKTLNAGESAEIQIETPPIHENTIFPLVLTMRESGGSVRTIPLGNITVLVTPAAEKDPILMVSVNPEGNAPFTFTISGAGKDLNDVVLSESSLGDIKRFLVIPSGSTTVFSPELSVTRGSAMQFSIRWEENGETHTLSCPKVTADHTTGEIESSGLTAAAYASLHAVVSTTGLPRFVLILSMAVIALIILTLIVLRVRRAKKQKRDRLGHTNKFTPVRTRDKEKENG